METLNFDCDIKVLSRCNGSAKVSTGKTIVLAGIHGPNESKSSQQNFRRLNIDLRVFYISSSPSDREKMSSVERLVLDSVQNMLMTNRYPRLSITLTLQVIQDFGSLVACCLNAACLALIDSGLEMRHTIAAVSCLIRTDEKAAEGLPRVSLDQRDREKDHPLTQMGTFSDVNNEERKICLALSNRNNAVVTSHCTGSFSEAEIDRCVDFVTGYAAEIFQKYKMCVKSKLIDCS